MLDLEKSHKDFGHCATQRSQSTKDLVNFQKAMYFLQKYKNDKYIFYLRLCMKMGWS